MMNIIFRRFDQGVHIKYVTAKVDTNTAKDEQYVHENVVQVPKGYNRNEKKTGKLGI